VSSPSFDVINHSTGTSGTTVTSGTLTPATSPELLVVIVSSAHQHTGTAPAVSSITQSNGVTLTQYYTHDLSNVAGQFANGDYHTEIWVGALNSTSSFTVSTTFASTAQGYDIRYLTVKNLYAVLSWFDGDAGLPYHDYETSATYPSVTFNTQQADDLLFYYSYINTTAGQTTPSGWSVVFNLGSTLAGNAVLWPHGYSKSVSAVQTSVTVATSSSNQQGGIGLVLAFTADAKPTAYQTFVTIVCS
jgi:hypothetical protein